MTSQAKIVVTAEDRASRVLGQVRGQLAATGTSAGELAASAGLIGPAFATLASAAGLVGFVKGVADAVDKLNDVADATGASIESLSSLERVARLNGGTLDDVSGILVKFNKALSDASDPASSAARVFSALGLSAKDLQAADPAVALQKAAQALAGFADDGSKARITQELFGKSIRDAAPYLKDLAEAGQVNATVTREQAEQAERFNKTLFALQVTVSDVSRSLVINLGGALAELVERYKTAQQVFGSLGGILSAGLGQKLNFSDASEGLREYNKQLSEIDTRIKKVRDGSDGFAGRFSDQRIAALEKERVEVAKVAEYYRILVNAGSAGAGRGGVGGERPSIGNLPDKPQKLAATKEEIDKSAEALGRYIGGLYKEAEAATSVTERLRALNALRDAGSKGELPQVRALVLALADEADERERVAFFAKVSADATTREAQATRALDDALDGFSGRTAEALRTAQLARLEARKAAGEFFSPESEDRIVKGIYGSKAPMEKAIDDAGRSLERFSRTVENTFGDSVEAALRGNFSSIGKMWGDLLLKMAADALAADLTNALFGNLFKAPGAGVAGQGLGLIGGLLSGFGLGPGRAGGGTVNPMSLQPVNERGFEVFRSGGQDWLMTGASGGKVVPNSALGGPAPVSVVQHISIGAGVNRNQLMAAMQATTVQTLSAVSESQRRRYSGATA